MPFEFSGEVKYVLVALYFAWLALVVTLKYLLGSLRPVYWMPKIFFSIGVFAYFTCPDMASGFGTLYPGSGVVCSSGLMLLFKKLLAVGTMTGFAGLTADLWFNWPGKWFIIIVKESLIFVGAGLLARLTGQSLFYLIQ